MQYFGRNQIQRVVKELKIKNKSAGIKIITGAIQAKKTPLSKTQIEKNKQKVLEGNNGKGYVKEINEFLNKDFDEIFDGVLLNDTVALMSKVKTLADGSKKRTISDDLILKIVKRYKPDNPGIRDQISEMIKEKGLIKGGLNKRQVFSSTEQSYKLKEDAYNLLSENGLISKITQRKGLVYADRGHQGESFSSQRDKFLVNQHYFGQAAFDSSNKLHNTLRQKGFVVGETALTPKELQKQQKQLREQFGLDEFELLKFNKGGMIPGVQYLNLGGRLGKAIFERGIVGKPKIMNLSGLAKNGENVVIDLVNGGMKVDDAIKFAKLTQTGQLRTGIPTGPVRDIEDYIQRQISFEKSQGSMTRSLYKEFYGIRHKSKSEQQKIIDNYNKLYWGDMGTAMYNKGGIAKFNKGNIVPGVGSTDTVPAMLTPGEFVINKESTKQNYDLLTAINNGTMAGFNKGGKIPGIQYFAEENLQRVVQPVKRGPGIAGMVAGTAASMLPFAFTDQLGMMGSMVASMVGFSAASKATTTLVKSYGEEIANGVGRTKALSIAFKTLSKVALAGMGGWVALGTSII
jgi:hypothetical protein